MNFSRVRYAAIRRMNAEGISGEKVLGGISAEQLLKEITEIVIEQQSESLRILSVIEKQLEKENIFIINENQINKEQQNFLHDYFIQKVGPELLPSSLTIWKNFRC